MSAGSAGSEGVPTRLRRYMSQCTVPAPAARASDASPGPPVATTTPARANRSRQNVTELSAKSIQVVGVSGRPHESAVPPAVGQAKTATSAPASARKALHMGVTGKQIAVRKDGGAGAPAPPSALLTLLPRPAARRPRRHLRRAPAPRAGGRERRSRTR